MTLKKRPRKHAVAAPFTDDEIDYFEQVAEEEEGVYSMSGGMAWLARFGRECREIGKDVKAHPDRILSIAERYEAARAKNELSEFTSGLNRSEREAIVMQFEIDQERADAEARKPTRLRAPTPPPVF